MAVQSAGGFGGAVLGGGVGGSLGLFAGPIVAKATDGSAYSAIIGAMIGGAIGCSVGIVLGVQYVGGSERGTGHWYGTALGEVGGIALLGTGTYAFEDHPPPRAVSILLGTTLVVGGPVIGYHLTAGAHRTRATPRLVVPLFAAAF